MWVYMDVKKMFAIGDTGENGAGHQSQQEYLRYGGIRKSGAEHNEQYIESQKLIDSLIRREEKAT